MLRRSYEESAPVECIASVQFTHLAGITTASLPVQEASRQVRTDSADEVLRQNESTVGRPHTADAGCDVTGRSRDTSATSGNPGRRDSATVVANRCVRRRNSLNSLSSEVSIEVRGKFMMSRYPFRRNIIES